MEHQVKSVNTGRNWKWIAVLLVVYLSTLFCVLVLFNLPILDHGGTINQRIKLLISESYSDPDESVRRHLLLNESSEMTIANIDDVDVLRDQDPDFYESAEVGDKLVFVEDKVLIYRPASDQIINIATVDFRGT